jgi:hypothetical protein
MVFDRSKMESVCFSKKHPETAAASMEKATEKVDPLTFLQGND